MRAMEERAQERSSPSARLAAEPDVHSARPASDLRRARWLAGAVILLTLLFALPFYNLTRLALDVSLHSHVILIPFISGYLAWQRRDQLPFGFVSSWGGAAGFAVAGLGCLAWSLSGVQTGSSPADALAPLMAGWVCLILAAALAFLGAPAFRVLLFPALFLFFVVPLPSPLVSITERVLQHLSAGAAEFLFWVSGETYFRDGLQFRFPGLSIQIARECSGIRSTLVLLITSLLAGHMLLKTKMGRVALLLSIVPIAVARNGFRVFTISWLTVHVDPGVIDGPLHHRGGPIFFVLSLVVLLAAAWIVKRLEVRIGLANATQPITAS